MPDHEQFTNGKAKSQKDPVEPLKKCTCVDGISLAAPLPPMHNREGEKTQPGNVVSLKQPSSEKK